LECPDCLSIRKLRTAMEERLSDSRGGFLKIITPRGGCGQQPQSDLGRKSQSPEPGSYD
jgi:hypothetical protein